MKLLTSHYYRTIKVIEYDCEELVAKISPKIKKGDRVFFLQKASEDLYLITDIERFIYTYGYFKYMDAQNIISNIRLGYKAELIDGLIVIHRCSYIKIDGVKYVFKNEEEYRQHLNVLKSRCHDSGNQIYRNVILD